jgi:hypothetical protein
MVHPIRQTAAICFIATLSWDYCRAPEVLSYFSSWSLFIQFIYFQLPIKSRALAYAHSIAFICANTLPLHYLYMLLWNPQLELNHADSWDISYTTVIIRTILIHFAPVLFHAIDVNIHQQQLIVSYHTKSRRLMILWTLLSYAVLCSVYELTCGASDDETDNNIGTSIRELNSDLRLRLHGRSLVSFLSFLFAFFLLTMLVLRPAYLRHS